MQLLLGTCESAVCVQIESGIESVVMIRIESQIESAISTSQHVPQQSDTYNDCDWLVRLCYVRAGHMEQPARRTADFNCVHRNICTKTQKSSVWLLVPLRTLCNWRYINVHIHSFKAVTPDTRLRNTSFSCQILMHVLVLSCM